MSDTPDISKIISLIMENPDLIEKISALAKGTGESESVPTPKEKSEDVKTSANLSFSEDRGDKRARLLSAMKPYLSETRGRAIDSMLGIVNVIDMVRGGG